MSLPCLILLNNWLRRPGPPKRTAPTADEQTLRFREGRRKGPRNSGPDAVVIEDDSSVQKGFEQQELPANFSLDFTCPNDRPIKAVDSLLVDPHLAMTLLMGIVFPKDMSKLPKNKIDNVAEMCFYAAKAGQSDLRHSCQNRTIRYESVGN